MVIFSPAPLPGVGGLQAPVQGVRHTSFGCVAQIYSELGSAAKAMPLEALVSIKLALFQL